MGWDIVLSDWFYDATPGSTTGPTCDQIDRKHEAVLRSGVEAALHLVKDLGDRIYGQGKDTGREKPGDREVVVVSTQGYKREDTVTVSGVARGETASACDYLRHGFPVQYTGEDTLIFHVRGIPSCGCVVCSLMGAGDSGRSGPTAEHPGYAVEHSGYVAGYSRPWPGFFENDWYRAEFNDKMELASLVEKGTGGQLLEGGRVGNQLLTFGDRSMSRDNWDVDMYYQKEPYHAELVTAPILREWGPVRTVVPISHRFADSLAEQDIVFYPNLPRIDFVTRADQRGHHVLLRVYFPARIDAIRATYEAQLDNVGRETINNHSWDTAKFKVCVHKQADLSENGLGLSPLNDCKYGHSTRNREMGLTLIKSGTYPNKSADIGVYEFTYFICPHKGQWQGARTTKMAYGLNSPLVSTLAPVRGLGGFWSKISVDQPCCLMEMMKKAGDENGYILCIYENHNTRMPMTVNLGSEISHVEECDLLGRTLRSVETDEYRFEDFIRSYEIKTYRVSHTDVQVPTHQESKYKGGFTQKNRGHGG